GLPVITDPQVLQKTDWVIPANVLPTLDQYERILQCSRDRIPLPASAADPIRFLQHPWQLYQWNDWAIRQDFSILTYGRLSEEPDASNQLIHANAIFIEPGAQVQFATLNARYGPIYIGRNAEIMEGALIRGPFALGEGAVVKMGTRIYGATTIGPQCVAGGEIKNSILFECSNKGHDGYLGDSVLAGWCNLGAGTSNSNVKNTGGPVRFYTDAHPEPMEAGTKGGLIMAEYSRAAINTSFNTGTVVGVCCNLFGQQTLPNRVPNFTWGNTRYELEKAYKDIRNWKKMKGQLLTDSEMQLLYELYQRT
ncbi:MAG TPA: glucose-1-phosphate thymidylyltransferase, partial [Ferruginibacter sp.]|nr:glucose-1-phosphate thymidylyltransferase [Ferruginibacter sp.]